MLHAVVRRFTRLLPLLGTKRQMRQSFHPTMIKVWMCVSNHLISIGADKKDLQYSICPGYESSLHLLLSQAPDAFVTVV